MAGYTLTIDGARDIATLHWLADRGYDGGLWELCELYDEILDENGDAEAYVLTLDEPSAWEFQERAYEDLESGGFLACNGSETLAETILGLLDSIV